jgi:hypothetical protein
LRNSAPSLSELLPPAKLLLSLQNVADEADEGWRPASILCGSDDGVVGHGIKCLADVKAKNDELLNERRGRGGRRGGYCSVNKGRDRNGCLLRSTWGPNSQLGLSENGTSGGDEVSGKQFEKNASKDRRNRDVSIASTRPLWDRCDVISENVLWGRVQNPRLKHALHCIDECASVISCGELTK